MHLTLAGSAEACVAACRQGMLLPSQKHGTLGHPRAIAGPPGGGGSLYVDALADRTMDNGKHCMSGKAAVILLIASSLSAALLATNWAVPSP